MNDKEKIEIMVKALEKIAFTEIISPAGSHGSNHYLVQRYKDIAIMMQEEAMNALGALND